MRKAVTCFACILSILLLTITPALRPGYAAPPADLTWDGAPATLREIADRLEYDMIGADGSYKPMYYESAKALWGYGILRGADGVFNLDAPLSRAEGIIVVLRLLGKEKEALDQKLDCPFTDVPDWAKYHVAYAAANKITYGYSETLFGSSDPMTANQFLTLVLRAMGYSDRDGDFVWDRATEKALEIKIIGSSCRDQYARSNLFLRDNVAAIVYNALLAPGKNGTVIADSLTANPPEENVPFATAADKQAATSQPAPTEPSAPPAGSVSNYEGFDVPRYESVDSGATAHLVKSQEDRLFFAYDGASFALNEYTQLLESLGFRYQGEINFEPRTVRTVTGGLVEITTVGWGCDWYVNGNSHVVFGRVGSVLVVRMYSGAVDTFSPDDLRRFYRIIHS